MQTRLPFLVFAIVILNKVNGIIPNNVKIENDPSESATNGENEFEKYDETLFVFNTAQNKKRDIVPRIRKTSENLELLKIPDREWFQFQVENRQERGKDVEYDNSASTAATAAAVDVYLSPDKEKDSCINQCVICDASFQYDKDYVNHCVGTHGNLYPYSCPHCESKFTWKRNLKQHVDQKHKEKFNPFSRRNIKEVKCEICGETKQSWYAFEIHALSTHVNERMMACLYCPKKYFRRSALLTHVRLKHDGQDDEGESEGEGECKVLTQSVDFQPTDCVKERERYYKRMRCKDQEQIGIQVKIENENNPKFCGNEMSSATSQGREQSRKYSSYLEGTVVKGKRKNAGNYKCPHCNLEVIGLVEYEKHGKSRHKNFPLYRCGKCQKGFFHQNTVKIHHKEKHENDKIRCSHCSNCYSNLGALRQHEYACERKARDEAMRKEQGLPSYTCDICKKEFYMKWNSFKKHIKRHEKYVYCYVCNKGFGKPNTQELAEHIRVRHPLLENIDALLQMAAKEKVKCENVNDVKMKSDYVNENPSY